MLKLIVLLAVLEVSGFDVWLQDFFYDFDAKKWFFDRDDIALDWLFYTGPKSIVIAIGVCLTLATIGSFFADKLKPYRTSLLLTAAAMAIITAGVSVGKAVTHIHCPRELQHYDGQAIYNPITEKAVGHFAAQPAGVKQGRCFPAGHASGGFALMAFAVLLSARNRKWAYGAGLGAGWWMAAYQTFTGAHFLSHSVTTMLWAVFVTQMMLHVTALLDCRTNISD